MDTILIIASIFTALALGIWLGLRLKPAPYPPFGQLSKTQECIPLPNGLPAPVERFYQQKYGDAVPLITSAVLSGRGSMAPFGVRFPIRFRFIYEVGKNYRAMFEGTFFRWAWMKADETYIDGRAVGKVPAGVDQGPWFDDAMNLRVYCEILNWFPAALLSAHGVRWEPIDEETALLIVPFGSRQQRIVTRFDRESGKLLYFEGMKYRNANTRVLWANGIWFDQGKPWIFMETEETLFNVEVRRAIVEGSADPRARRVSPA